MHRPHRVLNRAASVVLALSVVLSIAQPSLAASAATDDGSVSWGVRTADNSLGTARQNFVYTAAPGAQIDDALVVTNRDDVPLELDVYAADGFTTQSGQLDLLPRAEESAALGIWVATASSHVVIDAGASLEIPFSVTIPENATPGDYLGGVLTSLVSAEQGDTLAVDRRLGVRIQLRVDGALAPGMVVENLTTSYQPTLNPFGPGTVSVQYSVRNTGNTRLSSQQSVALSGPFGLGRADIADVAPVPDLLPGETWSVTVTSEIVPLFWLGVDVTLAPAGPAGFEGAADPKMFVTSTGIIAIPWAQLVLLLLLIGTIVLIVTTSRRSRRRRRDAEDARVQAAVAAALEERETADV